MKDEHYKIIERIKKLHDHAASAQKLGSLEEAQAFAAKVQEMLVEYNLTLWEVESTQEQRDEQELLQRFGKGEKVSYRCSQAGHGWKLELLNTLATANFCRGLVQSQLGTAYVYGRLENIETTMWLYHYLSTQLMYLAQRAWRERKQQRRRTSRFRFLRHWLLGAVDGVETVVMSQKAKNSSSELMLYNEKALNDYKKAADIQVNGTYSIDLSLQDMHVYQSGYEQGRKVTLSERKLHGTDHYSSSTKKQAYLASS